MSPRQAHLGSRSSDQTPGEASSRQQGLHREKVSRRRGIRFAICADVTKKRHVDATFSQFAGDGKINVLVYAAAVIGPKETVTDDNGEEYLDAVQIKLAGSLWAAKAFLRHAALDGVAVAMKSWGAHLSLNDAFT